ncbi:dihydrolipoamide acetyltransferase family protein [Hydrogenophaga sp.]|uniref:dihydrolipoamide acetyltransferase family protein n=1 Tax=Hydrogenophaga sp. TaxID=1904254 RepID=UPI00273627A0|nr:dihydrolipoamide acetyltransferase family protein [Hydrogenophaga sp.]MDP3884717.1 dihydrolipoamide acetyltransferase family protein [Hydrogenophaga sp.]
MAEFLMPSLGADMETGTVVQWLVQPGARVNPGDVVAVVETHKGAIDVEIFLDGVIGELAPLGESLPVGAVLARVAVAGEEGTSAPPAALVSRAAPSAIPSSVAGAPVEAPAAVPALPEMPAATPQRARVSPAARRRAQALGLQPDALRGTGMDGSVTLADVERAASQPQPAAMQAVAPQRVKPVGFDAAQMRQAIAAAMSRSKREIPHYYLAETVDFAAAQAWLDHWNRDRLPQDRLLSAVLLLKATALALRDVPQLNGFYESGQFRHGDGIHIGWAIALRGGGLVAPAIHHADQKTLPELMSALRDLVQRARAGGLRSSELTDPTITVSSLGDRGAASVWGVIYPPQVAIVGFGRVLSQPWVVDGQVLPRPVVNASLAADHRASDGHLGGQLLVAIHRALQTPQDL